MSVNIKAPSLKPPRVSILSSGEVIDVPGDRWWRKIEATKLSADPAQGTIGLGSADPSTYDEDDLFLFSICPEPESTKLAWPRNGSEIFTPIAIYANDNCASFSSAGLDFLDRVKQKIAVNEPWVIERLIWEGQHDFSLAFVDSQLAPLAADVHPLEGFSLLDSTVARNRHDGRGMIHMTPYLFDLLQQYELFRREGNVWFSPLDNIVVPGRGYTGNGPDADTATATSQYMFGHPGIIQIVRSELMTFPENEEQLLKQMERLTNDITVYAERVVVAMYQNGLNGGETDVFSVSVNPALAVASAGGGGGGDASAANQVTGNNLLTSIEAITDPTIVAEAVAADEAIAAANWLHGWSVWNTNAGITEITIHNGNDATDPVLARFRLAENESYTAMLPRRLPAPDGIHFEVVSGSAVGTVYYEA